jgi:hypothetical protein
MVCVLHKAIQLDVKTELCFFFSGMSGGNIMAFPVLHQKFFVCTADLVSVTFIMMVWILCM